jgi:hypothetical protein
MSKGLTAPALVLLVLALSMSAPVVPVVHAVDPGFQKAMVLFSTGANVYQSQRAVQSLANMVGLGVNHIGVQVVGFMDTRSSTAVYLDANRSATDESVGYIIQKIHEYGLKVTLRINVDVNDGSLRKQISPIDWNTWWQSYRAFVLHYAALAQNTRAEIFLIGTEFDSVVENISETLWRQLIADIRVVYSGEVTYGASRISCRDNQVPVCVPGYREVKWWDAFDYAGIDAWFPLTKIRDPTVAQLKAGWTDFVADMKDWQLYIGKPVLFTEIGYSSYDGTNMLPSKAWEGQPLDFQEQVDASEAAFQTFFEEAWLLGMYWWYWSPDPNAGGMSNGSWYVQNKPAQQTVAMWYARVWPSRQTSFVAQPGLTTQLTQPRDKSKLQSFRGVTLGATVSDNLDPAISVKVTFYANSQAVSVAYTNTQGVATCLYSPLSGNYSWYATAEKPGYRTGVSQTRMFQYTATPRVDLLSPKDGAIAANPVKLKAKVIYASAPVADATVVLYVDRKAVGTATTDATGCVTFVLTVGAGSHQWYVVTEKTGYATTTSTTRTFSTA